jgi:hypothetical protein
MAARLGNVLYWLGCIVAVCWFAFTMVFFVTMMVAGAHPEPLAVSAAVSAGLAVLAVIPWGIGRGLRYILAGPRQTAGRS